MCSATGRGAVRSEMDFYPSPRAAYAPLLDILPVDVDFYDPCAGDGRIIRWLKESGRNADGRDLYPPDVNYLSFDGLGYDPTPTDFLQDTTHRDFSITNPSFGIAFQCCQHAKKHSNEFMFLLRLSFLESEERGDWLTENEPSALFVLRKRPSFVLSITCKTIVKEYDSEKLLIEQVPVIKKCGHNWMLPIESERPTECPKCGGSKLSISSSDNCGYAHFYWGHRFSGIHHI